jgi:hypothetical protein
MQRVQTRVDNGMAPLSVVAAAAAAAVFLQSQAVQDGARQHVCDTCVTHSDTSTTTENGQTISKLPCAVCIALPLCTWLCTAQHAPQHVAACSTEAGLPEGGQLCQHGLYKLRLRLQ